MATAAATVFVGPGDGVHVRLSDQGVIGGIVSVDLKQGERTVLTLVWNNGAADDLPDTVNGLVQWLDMVAAEVRFAASGWTATTGPF